MLLWGAPVQITKRKSNSYDYIILSSNDAVFSGTSSFLSTLGRSCMQRAWLKRVSSNMSNRWVIWNQDSSILIRKKKRHSATEENEVWIPSSIKFTLRKCCAVKQCHPVVLNRASFVIALSRTLVPSTDILSFHFNFHIYFAIQEPLLLLGRKQKTFSIQKLSAFSVSFPITQTLNVKPLIIILWDLRRLRAWDKC